MPGEFNWSELHKNGFGAQELWSLYDYNYDEVVGYGLSDRSFFNQLSENLKDLNESFFIQAPTLYRNSSMGRILVNTNKDATVIKGNIIVGNVKDKNEEEHLLNAYSIGEKIIKNNFFTQSKS